ncbi:MAG: nucleotidyltransferase [Methylococcales symbiont of Hymedesmia sp. n. MRB-2018]|nr:MAG: nucleotidyltransferase [Methylococcales symbiont of Hymedesmia sp. n. MRB-2018]
MNNEIRWKQRFQNFEKSYEVFQRRINEYQGNNNVEAYQMALIQSFEITIELSWKMLKDYLQNAGTKVNSPKQVIRQSFQFEIISNGEKWMEALELRNLTTHTYDEETAIKVLNFVSGDFYLIIRDLYFDLKKEL